VADILGTSEEIPMKKHAERNGKSRRELSERQQAAVELLTAGKTDKEAAKELNLPGDSVVKWRMHDPVFQAALNA
jgi:DNA-binding NarL/FixJ family response regulator